MIRRPAPFTVAVGLALLVAVVVVFALATACALPSSPRAEGPPVVGVLVAADLFEYRLADGVRCFRTTYSGASLACVVVR